MLNIVYGGYGSFCFCLRSRRCAERSSCDESVEIVVGLSDPKLHFQRIFVFGFSVCDWWDCFGLHMTLLFILNTNYCFTDIRLNNRKFCYKQDIQPASTEASKIYKLQYYVAPLKRGREAANTQVLNGQWIHAIERLDARIRLLRIRKKERKKETSRRPEL